MDIQRLKVSQRKAVGNGPARVLRKEGKIPAVLYGPNTESMKLTIEKADLEVIFKAGAVIQKLITLEIEGVDGNRNVMIKELQKHPVSNNLLHLDFYEVSMDQKIKVMVPVVTTGTSVGVELGGMLQIVRRELEVFCLPDRIPENVTIDVSDMNIGDSFHLADLQLEGDVEIQADVNFTILTVLTTKFEEEEVEGEEDEEMAEEDAEAAETGEEPAAE